MSVFLPAMAVVWAHEVDPHDQHKITVDTGGTTKYGISCNWAKAIVPDCTDEFIRNLTPDQAKELYKKHFWDPYLWFKIADQTVANKLFDMAVNMGPQQAIRLGQLAVGDCGTKVTVDGILGDQTVSSLNLCNCETILTKLINRQVDFYQGLANGNPKKFKKYLTGWLVRAGWPLGRSE